MGQKIEISEAVILGDVAVFDSDRTLSGQDGETYRSAGEAASGDSFPAQLAEALFEAVDHLESVYVFSNAISVTRTSGWDAESTMKASAVIESLFIFYR